MRSVAHGLRPPSLDVLRVPAALGAFRKRGGRNTVTTTVPLEGDITRSDAALWPSIFGVVR